MPRKKRPSTQNEISVTLRLLKLHLRNHPRDHFNEAIDECLRELRELRHERQQQFAQELGLSYEEYQTQTNAPEQTWLNLKP